MTAITNIQEICAGMLDLHQQATTGEWGKGASTHHTVARRNGFDDYRVAEFRHAADAEFCDFAHAHVVQLVEALQAAQARVAELEAEAEAARQAAPVAYLHDDGYWTSATPGQGLDLKRPITRLAVFADAPPGSGGWKVHAESMEKERDHWRTLAETMQAHKRSDVWYWQGDGHDNPASMVNSLVVVLRADQLRDVLAQADADGARWRWLFGARTAAQAADAEACIKTALPQDHVLSELQVYYVTKAHADRLVDHAMAAQLQEGR